MQTFINFHSKLSVSHVGLDSYKIFIEPAHVLHLTHLNCSTDLESWVPNLSATEILIPLRETGQISRKPAWNLGDEQSPVSFSLANFICEPKQLRRASVPC